MRDLEKVDGNTRKTKLRLLLSSYFLEKGLGGGQRFKGCDLWESPEGPSTICIGTNCIHIELHRVRSRASYRATSDK